MTGLAFAGTRLLSQRLDAHAAYERGDVAPANLDAKAIGLVTQHARAMNECSRCN